MLAILSIILSFLLYIIYVLVPMYPALKIYKKFPTDKIGVKGILGNLSINASGAFAAYVITTILGYFIIQNTMELINELDSDVWTASAEIEFVDSNDSEIEIDQDLINLLENTLTVLMKPVPRHSVAENLVDVDIPKYDKSYKLVFSLEGFPDVTKPLDEIEDDKINHIDRKIDLGTVQLRVPFNSEYDPDQ